MARFTGYEGYLGRLCDVIAAARGAGIPVIHVRPDLFLTNMFAIVQSWHPELVPSSAAVSGQPSPR
jgi:hypothetical protein